MSDCMCTGTDSLGGSSAGMLNIPYFLPIFEEKNGRFVFDEHISMFRISVQFFRVDHIVLTSIPKSKIYSAVALFNGYKDGQRCIII